LSRMEAHECGEWTSNYDYELLCCLVLVMTKHGERSPRKSEVGSGVESESGEPPCPLSLTPFLRGTWAGGATATGNRAIQPQPQATGHIHIHIHIHKRRKRTTTTTTTTTPPFGEPGAWARLLRPAHCAAPFPSPLVACPRSLDRPSPLAYEIRGPAPAMRLATHQSHTSSSKV
jgi:hypothetical protein